MPFGLNRYERLPQGISTSPDVAQEVMENLLCDFLYCVVCYFNDIALFSDSWTHHIDLINKVCTIIEQAGFKVNLIGQSKKWNFLDTLYHRMD